MFLSTDNNDYVTLGRRFVLGFLEGGGDPTLYVTTQSAVPIWVNVTITNSAEVLHQFAVASNQYIALPIPPMASFQGTGPQPSVVLVEAESAISVYGVTKTENRLGDGFTAIPEHNLGTIFYLASFSPESTDQKDVTSQLAVIATKDATKVNVHTPTSIVTFDLDKYEAYQLQNVTDLTSTFVTSDKPIAVFGGTCATVGLQFGKGDCQLLVEQIPDVNSLGRQYFVAPPLFNSITGLSHVVRVIATMPNTSIEIAGTSNKSVVLKSGDYEDYEEVSGNTTLITADKPVLVIQFTTNLTLTGPSMTVIPSIQMFTGEINFVVPPSDNQNYISIMSRCSDGPRLVLTNNQIGNETGAQEWDRQYRRDQMCVYQRWITESGSYNVAVDTVTGAQFFVLVGGWSDVSYALPVAYQKGKDEVKT